MLDVYILDPKTGELTKIGKDYPTLADYILAMALDRFGRRKVEHFEVTDVGPGKTITLANKKKRGCDSTPRPHLPLPRRSLPTRH